MNKDYYQILGVSKTASQDDIKKAYRKLAIENHPDKHKTEKVKYETKFKEINEAYSVLSDVNKRSQYDNYGSADGHQSAGHGGGFGGFSQGGFDFDFSNINEMFGDFFSRGSDSSYGRQKQKSTSSRGSDLKYTLNISLTEAFNGCKHEIEFSALSACKKCSGSGSKDGSKSSSKCKTCGGNGAIRMQKGFFIVEQTCRDCNGEGSVISNPCDVCSGAGRTNQRRKVSIDVPSGIEHETSLRLKGQGEAGENNGLSGDLYVLIKIKKHEIFTRVGSDLFCDVPIKFSTACLGGKINITGIDGHNIEVQIPKGTQNNDKISVKNQGMTIVNGSKRGNLIINANIEIPVKLSKEQEDLLMKFESISDPKSNPKSSMFFEKLKDIFSKKS